MSRGFWEVFAVIAVSAAVTVAVRAVPFLLFGKGRTQPAVIGYLGKALPPAVMAMLVVYCLKGTTVLSWPYGLPELISVAAVVLLHLWKRNTLLSIFGGTALYMLCVQVLFV